MRLCLVEDNAAGGLEPLTLTRPAFELMLGSRTLGEKIAEAFGIPHAPGIRGAMTRSHLTALWREREPGMAINDRQWLGRGPTLVANSRWVPPVALNLSSADYDAPWVGYCDDQPCCIFATQDQSAKLESQGTDAWFEELAPQLPGRSLDGEWIRHPWDLVHRNSRHLARDFERRGQRRITAEQRAQVAIVGPVDRLDIDPTVRFDPYTVLDTINGPITIEANVVVQPFTRVEGPCHIGAKTQLFRANLRGGVTLGPNCRIGGEVEESLVLGHSNKYHEGFLGHAYVGEWVNLGAITSNSDLRNDYGEVFVPLSGDPIATGQLKVGCFIGDHTRTGLGSMINTGTSIGVMCNILPAGPLLPKHVPSFTAVLYGRVAPGFTLEQLFDTARVVKGRRDQAFTAVEEQLYLDLFERTRLERERAEKRAVDKRTEPRPAAVSHR